MIQIELTIENQSLKFEILLSENNHLNTDPLNQVSSIGLKSLAPFEGKCKIGIYTLISGLDLTLQLFNLIVNTLSLELQKNHKKYILKEGIVPSDYQMYLTKCKGKITAK